jgi:hypothetical protein
VVLVKIGKPQQHIILEAVRAQADLDYFIIFPDKNEPMAAAVAAVSTAAALTVTGE